MLGTVNAFATAGILRAFCDSFDEAERVMKRIEGWSAPLTWNEAWRDIEIAVQIERGENW